MASPDDLKAALGRWCDALEKAAPELNGLDGRLGDGDLGATLEKCARNVRDALPGLDAQFDTLFNKKVVDAVTGQTYETLFVNGDGIMFGTGELWITGVCDDEACETPFVTIIAINNE